MANPPRIVSRPGVNSDPGKGTGFISPWQPPPSDVDLRGDLTLADPNAYHPVLAGGTIWRCRIPSAAALEAVNDIMTLKGGAQIRAINNFLSSVLHPDDMRTMLRRMMNPSDPFDADAFTDLWRGAATVGTARPFRQSSDSPEPPPIAGVSFVPSSPSRACRRHCSPSRPCTRCSTLWNT